MLPVWGVLLDSSTSSETLLSRYGRMPVKHRSILSMRSRCPGGDGNRLTCEPGQISLSRFVILASFGEPGQTIP